MLIPSSVKVSTDTQDEITLADIGVASLLIPQEPEIFSESFIYNLNMGEAMSEDRIQQFVYAGKLDVLVAKLPQGYETNLKEKGLNLSVGEKQRVAMVRGLLRAND